VDSLNFLLCLWILARRPKFIFQIEATLMENQEAPTPTEPRAIDQELLQLFNEIATAYQIDKQHQEAVDQRAHQLRLMTEQHRHDEAVRWISSLEAQRKEHYEHLRHQFDRQFWLVVGLAVVALAVMCGLIFVKDDLKTATAIFIAILSYIAGRRGQNLLTPAGPIGPRPADGKPPEPPRV
jgi:hypothetical protein